MLYFLDSYKKYRKQIKMLCVRAKCGTTERVCGICAACSKIFRIIDKLKLSKDASIAVFENLYRVANNKLN